MNSKLEQTLHELYVHGYNTANRHKPKAQDIAVAEAEKAIRQAVGEEMLRRLPSDDNVTTKYGYHRDEKKYGYRMAIVDVKEVIKQWSEETTE